MCVAVFHGFLFNAFNFRHTQNRTALIAAYVATTTNHSKDNAIIFHKVQTVSINMCVVCEWVCTVYYYNRHSNLIVFTEYKEFSAGYF